MKHEEADPVEPVEYQCQETSNEESDEADQTQVPPGSLEKSDVDISILSPYLVTSVKSNIIEASSQARE